MSAHSFAELTSSERYAEDEIYRAIVDKVALKARLFSMTHASAARNDLNTEVAVAAISAPANEKVAWGDCLKVLMS